MYTLGLGLSPHDCSYALIKDGKVVTAIEEERLTRIKHGMHYDSGMYTLAREAHYFDSSFLEPKVEILDARISQGIEYLIGANGITRKEINLIIGSNLLISKPSDDSFVCISHHRAHAAHAFFASSFAEAAILVIDGAGDDNGDGIETVSIYKGSGNSIKLLHKIRGSIQHHTNTIIALSNSIGVLYQNASAVCGFGPFGTGKLMGLASYGKPRYMSEFKKFIKIKKDIALIDNLKLYHLMQSIIRNSQGIQNKADLGATVQKVTNLLVGHYAGYAYALTKCKNLCYAGGVAQNAVTNTRLFSESDFRHIYIPSAPGDNGVSIGAALYGEHVIRGIRRTHNASNNDMPYFGRSYSEREIKKEINRIDGSIVCKRYSETIYNPVADAIAENKTVAWFQSGSEFGPRALGHRSIFANPTNPKSRDELNAIKSREWFRPVAPILLDPPVSLLFNLPKDRESKSLSYMLFILKQTSEETARKIPSAVHIDKSARIQTLTKKDDQLVYKLLRALEWRIGIAGVINTSFNIGDEPIVETPADAIKTYLRSDIDILAIGPYFITKKRYGK